jgi:hypothetical protein
VILYQKKKKVRVVLYTYQTGAQQEAGNSTLVIRVKIIVVVDKISHTGTLI